MADGLLVRLGSPSSPLGVVGASITFRNFTLDATTDAVELVFQVDEAVTITDLGFRYGARTGTPPTYQVSLQGVDGSGNPDGTIKGAGNNCKATFTPPADTTINGLWQWKATGESYTTTRGERLALVIAYASGTVDASNCSSFTSGYTGVVGTQQGFPYLIENNAGSRARTGGSFPAYGVKSASKTYGYPLQSSTGTQHSSNSTPDERALKFTLPADWGSTFQIVGISISGTGSAAGKTVLVTLFDTDGTTPLQTVTWDSDLSSAVGSARGLDFLFDETTLSTLTFGSTYRVSVAPQEVTSNFAVIVGTQAAATDWQGWPLGTQCALSTRTDAGAWTDDTLSRPWIDLILKDITEPSGGGGGGGARYISLPGGAH